MSFNKKFLAAGLIFASFSTSLLGSPTKADDEQKYYLTVGGGLAAIQDTDWDWSVFSGSFEHSSGFTGEIGLGRDFGRSSLEITYARNTGDLDAISRLSLIRLFVNFFW